MAGTLHGSRKSTGWAVGSQNLRRLAVWCTVFIIIVLTFLGRNMLQSASLGSTVDDYQAEHAIHIKEHALYNDNKSAFVFGATGPYSSAELFKCMSAIESLVKIGGWGGDVYLLIDDTTCLDTRMLQSLPNKNIQVIPFLDEEGGRRRRLRESNFTALDDNHRKLFNTQPFERSMAIKTHILDYLRPHVEYAMWYDCDVLFARPSCVKTMLSEPLDITPEQPIAIPFPYHVGSFAVRQNVSRPALQQWRSKILGQNTDNALGQKHSVPDYLTFKELFGGEGNVTTSVDKKKGPQKVWTTDTNYTVQREQHARYALTPRVYHDIVIPETATNYSSLSHYTHCVIHLTNGRCRHFTPQRLQALVQSFHLSSLRDHQWCPSTLRRKFKTYGLKWPFCWTPSFF